MDVIISLTMSDSSDLPLDHLIAYLRRGTDGFQFYPLRPANAMDADTTVQCKMIGHPADAASIIEATWDLYTQILDQHDQHTSLVLKLENVEGGACFKIGKPLDPKQELIEKFTLALGKLADTSEHAQDVQYSAS